ncbi:long-chain fatty acid--CoA ligase [Paenibacillus chitinolyticus]|uniref:Acyl--CoA ligase n=1 Tax=Paenibacillus chitinolyticus TaxID=79263 RepID=A0A410WSC0_9BACL|nr:class I adenylate-forming enzyme family protein [Paenibacillus chitinolyticus]MCY9591233.1 acyl--CoA ligase [Paenibacillus chitinolyticus]MCY9595584.1 acyl--CoA ligase [Paenibacillus chitinolyticus]QAV17346.1 long-chain fatty acid--CoA ligase [Paenibacillus chitinolyticus]
MDAKLFFRQLLDHSGLCAVDGTHEVSYSRITELAQSHARMLEIAGLVADPNRGQRTVAIDVSVGWRAIPLFLAALRQKVTLVPVDPAKNPGLTENVLSWINPDLYITPELLNEDGELLPGLKPVTASPREELRDVAVVLYTSGTTGRPKGVMLTYGNIWSNVGSILGYFKPAPEDRLYLFRPLTYASAFTGELLPSLFRGAAVYFRPPDTNPLSTMKSIQRDGITILGTTPTVAATFARFRKRFDFGSLRCLMLSGECLTVRQAELIAEAFPGAAVWNAYGLTEASPRISCLTEVGAFLNRKGCVGKPLAGVEVKVLAEEAKGRAAAEGEEGVLYVRGPNVMKGYYGDPAATSLKIKGCWLRTGDRAVIREGDIYILGRADSLIIRGGVNMDPSEIESELMKLRGIKEALVFADHSEDRTRVHAWITCEKGVPMTQIRSTIVHEIKDSRLWPDVIEMKEELPKTASGKLIRPIQSLR